MVLWCHGVLLSHYAGRSITFLRRGFFVTRERKKRKELGPNNPYSVRLEFVRKKMAGNIDLKEFHARLTWVLQSDGKRFAVSYSAVRTWHFNREPPSSYLEQVARVYAVRGEWLLTGEGPMRKAKPSHEKDAAEIRRAVHISFREELGSLAPIGFFATEAIVLPALSNLLAVEGHRGPYRYGASEPSNVELAATLANAIALPVTALRLVPDKWPQSVKAMYVAQVCAALLVPLELEEERLIHNKQRKGHNKPEEINQ